MTGYDGIAEKAQIAAVSFANDYGPLPAANGGDTDAREVVLSRLVDALAMQGLRIAPCEISPNQPRKEPQ